MPSLSREITDAIAHIKVYSKRHKDNSDNSEDPFVSRGTGFLVSANHVLSALHVVAESGSDPPNWLGDRIELQFWGESHAATVVPDHFSVKDDWVLLRCHGTPNFRPIPLARVEETDEDCEMWGFADVNALDGKTFDGTILHRDTTYKGHGPVIEIDSRTAQEAPVHGLSGGPCLVAGAAVGVMRADLEKKGLVIAGALYACPVDLIVKACHDLDPPLYIRRDVGGGAVDQKWLEADASGATGFAIGDRVQVIQNIENQFNNIYQTAQAKPSITASLKMPLDELLEPHGLFGGRDDEMVALNDFVSQESSGYCFVTGESGFGKSALLANWIKALEARNQPVAYHFMNRLEGTASERETLEDLCEQLAAFHELSGSLAEYVRRLRRLYPLLLQIPPPEGTSVIVVLDGLDEAVDWQPEPDKKLFPHKLPEGIYVVFSARTIANKDWLVALNLPRDVTKEIILDTFDLANTQNLLHQVVGKRTSWATGVDVAQVAFDVSKGDPFYLNFLLQDIVKPDPPIKSLADLKKQPSGLDNYLDSWWGELRKTAKEPGVRDLLSYLLVAKGPLTRKDLSEISNEDELDDWTTDEAIQATRRHIVGDDKSGFRLSHPRFQDYLKKHRILEPAQKEALERLLRYCARWSEHHSAYALTHYTTQLMEASRVNELKDTVKDLHYLAVKTYVLNSSATITDLLKTQELFPDDHELRILTGSLINARHFLEHFDNLNDLQATLYSRLQNQESLEHLTHLLLEQLFPPYLTLWRPLPDLPTQGLIRTMTGHTSEMTGCAISASGKIIVSASWDKTAKVWSAQTGLECFTLIGHTDSVEDCAVSANGRLVVSASNDNTLKVWDSENGELSFTLKGHRDCVNGCAISASGKIIVSASSDETLKVWDGQTGQNRLTLSGHSKRVNDCAISNDGQLIVSASADGTLKAWDSETGRLIFTLKGHTGSVNSCAISASREIIVSTSDDRFGSRKGELMGWDGRNGKLRFSIERYSSKLTSCAISADGHLIVVADKDVLEGLYGQSGELRFRLKTGHPHWIRDCAVSADGSFIVSASYGVIKIWNTDDIPKRPAFSRQMERISGCDMSADGSIIVTNGGDVFSEEDSLYVWDGLSDNPDLLSNYGQVVKDCAITSDGKIIVAAYEDGTLALWDRNRGQCIQTLNSGGDEVTCCAISGDGRVVVAAVSSRTMGKFPGHVLNLSFSQKRLYYKEMY